MELIQYNSRPNGSQLSVVQLHWCLLLQINSATSVWAAQ